MSVWSLVRKSYRSYMGAVKGHHDRIPRTSTLEEQWQGEVQTPSQAFPYIPAQNPYTPYSRVVGGTATIPNITITCTVPPGLPEQVAHAMERLEREREEVLHRLLCENGKEEQDKEEEPIVLPTDRLIRDD